MQNTEIVLTRKNSNVNIIITNDGCNTDTKIYIIFT